MPTSIGNQYATVTEHQVWRTVKCDAIDMGFVSHEALTNIRDSHVQDDGDYYDDCDVNRAIEHGYVLPPDGWMWDERPGHNMGAVDELGQGIPIHPRITNPAHMAWIDENGAPRYIREYTSGRDWGQ